ncbi:hypothetical protein IUS39_23875 [Mycobacteroides abscessus subsp. massiliense]|uniref:hypothetical protein n=1 Tax=Mycobacteroides abscessus TaxID=36809 RepID=UPI0009266314|nr:hypothetical protein [Mycobacteroides abscessus]MBN7428718.1 hypothetical protein [Mycobacteroides abscessus subsp. massiliense]SIN48264.1 Uncharacterised protein [Mycobacteroides abscessus subsp. bolletii]
MKMGFLRGRSRSAATGGFDETVAKASARTVLGDQATDESVALLVAQLRIRQAAERLSAPDVTKLRDPSDWSLVTKVYAESGSYGLATSVAFTLEDNQRERDRLISEVTGLRRAIFDIRRFAPVDRMTPEQRKGYEEASLDLLMFANQFLPDYDRSQLPPLGCGRDEVHSH